MSREKMTAAEASRRETTTPGTTPVTGTRDRHSTVDPPG